MSIMKGIPKHVAIIMDGNGRWAQMRGKERFEGHIEGVDSVRRSVRAAIDLGVEYLTLYAFSTENWARPAEEVDALMELLAQSIINETPALVEQGVRVRFIGDGTRFSSRVQELFAMMSSQTAAGDKLTLVFALNYSSRDELRRAVRDIAMQVQSGSLSAEAVSEELISSALDTAGMPDPDLIIRTSGECRLSNFMLWQASYAEFYFPEVLWPDFGHEDMAQAIEVYSGRDRRFGKVKEE